MVRLDTLVVEVKMPDVRPEDVHLLRQVAGDYEYSGSATFAALMELADRIARMEFTARVASGEDAS